MDSYIQLIVSGVIGVLVALAPYYFRGFFDTIERKRVHLESVKALKESLSGKSEESDIIKELLFSSIYNFEKPISIKEIDALLGTKNKNAAFILYKLKRPVFEIKNGKLKIKNKYIKTLGNTRVRTYQFRTVIIYILCSFIAGASIQALEEKSAIKKVISENIVNQKSSEAIFSLLESGLIATLLFSSILFLVSLRNIVKYDIRQNHVDDLYR